MPNVTSYERSRIKADIQAQGDAIEFKNARKYINHMDYVASHKPGRPCTCHDLTFGGRCLNCGYEPEESR